MNELNLFSLLFQRIKDSPVRLVMTFASRDFVTFVERSRTEEFWREKLMRREFGQNFGGRNQWKENFG